MRKSFRLDACGSATVIKQVFYEKSIEKSLHEIHAILQLYSLNVTIEPRSKKF